MCPNTTIIIILGSRGAGMTLANAARSLDEDRVAHGNLSNVAMQSTQRRLVVEFYPNTTRRTPFRHRPQQKTLSGIESGVKTQMDRIGTSTKVVAILFVLDNGNGESTSFPFKKDSRFLGLEGGALFHKLTVVQLPSNNPVQPRHWSDLVNAGMRVDSFDGKADSAWRLVCRVIPEAVSDTPSSRMERASPSSSTSTLTGDVHSNGITPAPMDNLTQRYIDSACATGRHPDQVIILLVGQSGHGKSKTINRLVGQNLLEVGQNSLGSTTKVIQRVKVPCYDPDTKMNVTLALDDTPGDADTTYTDQAPNTALVRTYRKRYFLSEASDGHSSQGYWRTYPNVILLVASWDSIIEDAHNQPHEFTSAIGKSMYKLESSGLVDHDRSNVVVVITKSMSYMDEFADFVREEDKYAQWNVGAVRRRSIITSLQRKVFPNLAPWQIVFVENGGSTNIRREFPILPDGELSHQTLFMAIRAVIEIPGPDKSRDLAGIQALGLITGVDAEPFSRAEKVTLIDQRSENVLGSETASPDSQASSSSWGLQDLVKSYLGATYNPILGKFGHTCVLEMDASMIKCSSAPNHQMEDFTQVVNAQDERSNVALRLGCDFHVPNIVGLSAHYSGSSTLLSSRLHTSQMFTSQHVTGSAVVDLLRPELSPEMLKIIKQLPRWSSKSKQQYEEFFFNHGTHVVTRMALGGDIRVVVQDLQESRKNKRERGADTKSSLPGLNQLGFDIGTSAGYESTRHAQNTRGRRNIQIFRDGGRAVAAELTGILENHFQQLSDGTVPYSWPGKEIHRRWIHALESDPAFCRDNEQTDYQWLHTLGGLNESQVEDLRHPSRYGQEKKFCHSALGRDRTLQLPRPGCAVEATVELGSEYFPAVE
ncbi:hypothetical protein DFH08DRAFT_940517 [Mycena albidolilacea]|uniref:MACPF domain-containing protein n=1 Tax=Mycena albidolilacea TaxID=1033008 RepID=A0AAD6ZML9_9AGAR|nr:hypothetical protein DFH08DRAFT_940517 [Mycena albidolilacea]